jgi:L-gulonolactone oxidase
MTTSSAASWRSWSGLATARPTQVLAPADVDDVADAVVAARAHGLTVRMVGSGHSFTDVAVTDGLMLKPDRLTGIRAVDRESMTVTVWAGTPLHELNARLAGLGLGLHNMGDIDRQTVAGAISTGTHGSGGRWASLSAQVTALELVTADGSLVRAASDENPDLFGAARVGLGAFGILTAVTFMVEPAFRLQAVEAPMRFDRVLADFDALVDEHHHVDIHWFPRTEWALVKCNDRTVDDVEPLSRARAFVDDDLLANRVFGLMNRTADAFPRAIPRLNRLAARALSGRRYVDEAPRVFVADRRVRFREMEYAVPREAGMAALAEARRMIDRSDWPITFPVEIRSAPADDVWLSTAYERPSVHLAFHVNARTDHRPYFQAVERVMRDHGGRPHWGKLHSRTAADLAPAYPRWDDVTAVRGRLDPDRIFTNRYLDRVLGG